MNYVVALFLLDGFSLQEWCFSSWKRLMDGMFAKGNPLDKVFFPERNSVCNVFLLPFLHDVKASWYS
jgi:hypothetical protein